MRRVLFASYGGFDFSTIAPVFPVLRRKGYEFAIMNRYDLAPSRKQLQGLTVFRPPDISHALLSEEEIERELATFLDTRSLQHLIPLWRGQSPGLRYLRGWSDHYFDFALETLHGYRPDLTVLSLGEAETAIIRRVCELTSTKYACLVPQRYEFKSLEAFEGHESARYMVAGEYGKGRLLRKGIEAEHILVTGNPRFDRLLASRGGSLHAPGANGFRRPGVCWPILRGAPRGSEKIILYTLQAVRNEGRVFQLLRRYISSRRGVRLVLRPHPSLPRRSYLPFVRHVISEPVSLALGGALEGLLQAADVLVSLWSLTVLEALIVGLPVISWKSDFFPEEMPFASRGDTMPARTYAELERALDRLLFDPDFRGSWVEKHRDCYVPYVGAPDGNAALRVAEAIEALIEDRATGAGTTPRVRSS